MSKFCKYCGAPTEENQMFCTRCGGNLQTSSQENANATTTNQQPVTQATQTQSIAAENMPQGNVQQNYIPQDNVQQNAMPQGNVQQNAMSQSNMQQNAMPQGNVQQNYAPQGNYQANGMQQGYVNNGMTQPYNMNAMPARKNNSKMIGIIIAVAVCVIFGVLKFAGSTPKQTIAKMEKAINSRNVNGVIECMDSKTRIALKASMAALGLAGQNTEELFEELGIYGTYGDFVKIKMEVTDVEKSDSTHATVNVKMRLIDSTTGEEDVDEDTIEMVKENGKWLIDISGMLF